MTVLLNRQVVSDGGVRDFSGSAITGQSVTGSGVTVAREVLALPPAVQTRPALSVASSLACRPPGFFEFEYTMQPVAVIMADSSSSSAAGAFGSSANRHSGMVPLSLAVALTEIVGAFAQKYLPILGVYASCAETVTDKAFSSTRVATVACGSPLCTKVSATAAILDVLVCANCISRAAAIAAESTRACSRVRPRANIP